MKRIFEIKEFEKIINTSKEVICFVHSPWSADSQIGLKKFNKTIEEEKGREYIIIDNIAADSFIYNWLESQEAEFANITFSKNAWIYGKGELIEIVNGSLKEFQESIK